MEFGIEGWDLCIVREGMDRWPNWVRKFQRGWRGHDSQRISSLLSKPYVNFE